MPCRAVLKRHRVIPVHTVSRGHLRKHDWPRQCVVQWQLQCWIRMPGGVRQCHPEQVRRWAVWTRSWQRKLHAVCWWHLRNRCGIHGCVPHPVPRWKLLSCWQLRTHPVSCGELQLVGCELVYALSCRQVWRQYRHRDCELHRTVCSRQVWCNGWSHGCYVHWAMQRGLCVPSWLRQLHCRPVPRWQVQLIRCIVLCRLPAWEVR
jgi:hypothetical protein